MKKVQYARETSGMQTTDCHAQEVSSLKTKLLLSVPEAAEVLGVSRRTLFLLLQSGELTRRKIRRRTVIHRDDLIRFAAGANQDGTKRRS
jgi:excisionase family DNA binding protein